MQMYRVCPSNEKREFNLVACKHVCITVSKYKVFKIIVVVQVRD